MIPIWARSQTLKLCISFQHKISFHLMAGFENENSECRSTRKVGPNIACSIRTPEFFSLNNHQHLPKLNGSINNFISKHVRDLKHWLNHSSIISNLSYHYNLLSVGASKARCLVIEIVGLKQRQLCSLDAGVFNPRILCLSSNSSLVFDTSIAKQISSSNTTYHNTGRSTPEPLSRSISCHRHLLNLLDQQRHPRHLVNES